MYIYFFLSILYQFWVRWHFVLFCVQTFPDINVCITYFTNKEYKWKNRDSGHDLYQIILITQFHTKHFFQKCR